jgi:hypothetical protein
MAHAKINNVKGYPIASLQTLLGLDSLGIEYLGNYPNNLLDLGPIVVAHGHVVRGKSPDTVAAMIDKSHEGRTHPGLRMCPTRRQYSAARCLVE